MVKRSFRLHLNCCALPQQLYATLPCVSLIRKPACSLSTQFKSLIGWQSHWCSPMFFSLMKSLQFQIHLISMSKISCCNALSATVQLLSFLQQGQQPYLMKYFIKHSWQNNRMQSLFVHSIAYCGKGTFPHNLHTTFSSTLCLNLCTVSDLTPKSSLLNSDMSNRFVILFFAIGLLKSLASL